MQEKRGWRTKGNYMKSEIVLISSWSSAHSAPPLGIAYLAAVLRKHGMPCQLVDYALSDYKEIKMKLKEFNPKIVGISLMSNNFNEAKKIAEIAKEINDCTVIVGGAHPTIMPVETLKEKCFDIAVIGEGEATFLDLVKTIKDNKDLSEVKGIYYKTKDNKITRTEPREFIQDLDSIPWPARDLLEMREYMKTHEEAPILFPHSTVVAARGCPFNCFFCQPTARNMFGRKARIRSPKEVAKEMGFVFEKYKLNSVTVTGDTLTFDKEWVYDFCNEIKKQKLKVNWVAGTRIDTVDLEMLKAMKEAGCYYVVFGVESGSQRILSEIMDKKITVEQIKKSFKDCKKAKMLARANLMIGSPTETKADIQDTIRLIDDIRPDYITTCPTNPLAGTYLYDHALEKKLLRVKDITKIDRRTENALKRELTDKEIRDYIKYFWYLMRRQNLVDMLLLRKPYRITHEFVRRLETFRKPAVLLDESISNLLLPLVILKNYFIFRKLKMRNN